jgi:thymidylate kinase
MSGHRLTIEIVGVAGSGKSTLARTLRTGYGCSIADSLHTRLPSHWPYVLHGLPTLGPLFAASVRRSPALSWDEVKFVVYVAEWSRFLRAERGERETTIVLDQGPIFALACLLWGRKPVTRSTRFDEWQQRMSERWSLELDAIVLLDAPDETLLTRIDERGQRHDVKGASRPEGLELVDRHRDAYGRVLERIESLGRPQLLRFDTAAMPPAAVAAELADSLGLVRVEELTGASPAPNVIHGRMKSHGDA